MNYTIQGSQDNATWADLTTGITILSGRAADGGAGVLLSGQPGYLRVVPINALGAGEPSDPIRLVPAALPSPPAVIRVTFARSGYLTLDWDVPTDTGGGDSTTVPAASIVYMLEVDEGFHDSSNLENFVPLTSYDPEGLGNYTSTVYQHDNLIPGHVYTYRVKAQNLMGYGNYSTHFSFIPRVPPGQPPLAPRNRPASTTRSILAFEYDAVLDEGGDAITRYSVHIDDGLDQDNFANFTAGTALSFDTSALTAAGSLTLVTGRTYRIKYQAINVAGEGPLSPEVSILLAEAPAAPSNLRRINIAELPAGQISVRWDLPPDNGGDPITGHLIFLDGLLYYNSSEGNSTLNEYTITSLTVGRFYVITVAARNRIGPGANASITLEAASLPPKLAMPDFESATSTSITVNASVPTYTGGSPVTAFAYRRDDGPATPWETQLDQTTLLSTPRYQFTGLSSTTRLYKFQMAAINAIGQGPWSDAVSYYATAPPPAPTGFHVQS